MGDIQTACEQNNYFLNAMLDIAEAAQMATEPFTVYKPKIYPDGDKWCVLLGVNIQNGVCGFGETPRKAVENFNANFNSQRVKPNNK